MKRKYTVILEREEEGGFHIYCPALPGCHSEGDTVEEAIDNVKEAIEAYTESLVAHGDSLPHDSDVIIAAAEVETGAPTAAS